MLRLLACLSIAVIILAGTPGAPAWAQPPKLAGQLPGQLAGRVVDAPPGFRESCARYLWLCTNATAGTGALGQAELLDLARRVNRRVNAAVLQVTDAENYGVAEYWTLPTNGRGDCEDFVLGKYRGLLDAGADGRDLSVAIVLDRKGNNHAVLVLRHETGDLVLDSLTPRIRPWNKTGYRFLARQSAADKRLWLVVANSPRDSRFLAQR